MLCNSLQKTVKDNMPKHVSQIHEIQCSSKPKIVFQEFISSYDPVSWAGNLFLDEAQVQNVLAVKQLTHSNL